MLTNLLKVILLSILTCLSCGKLYQVVSMFRHGARYHLNSYYDGNSTRQMWEQLTAVGMKQHQNLGKLLRRDYIDKLQFLTPDFKEGEIQVYTTETNRTFQSAISQLYGLYPLGTGQKLINVSHSCNLPPYSNTTDSLEKVYSLPQGLRTIPIYVNPQIILTYCKNYNKQVNKNEQRQLAAYKEMNMTYFPFLKRMAELFNISASMNFSIISSLYDTLTVDKYLGRPMPQFGFSDADYLNMRHLHYWYNFFKISFDLAKALNTGKIRRILNDFDDRIQNRNSKILKWTFLSAHDTDATTMLAALNISSAQCIEEMYRYGQSSALNCSPNQQYATNLIWELHSDDQENFYVKIRHDGEYVYLCEKNSFECDYQQWKNRVKSIIVDTDKVCNGPQVSDNQMPKNRYESVME